MKMEEGMQLIDGNGKFNVEGLKDFMTATGFAQCGLSYAIVAIIGQQSSGKSTLMNHVFGTNFKMLDAYKRRGQTTKGIWIARCNDMKPFTIAMDFEGTDSNARGEDNTAFERQSALFALAIADIILINMWYKDIGLEHAASRPLLKTVFQVEIAALSSYEFEEENFKEQLCVYSANELKVKIHGICYNGGYVFQVEQDVTSFHEIGNKLESFKTSLEQLLNGGEGFVASARTCAQSCFLQFDKGCEEFGEILHHPVSDAFIRLSGWNVSGVRGKLSRHMLSEMMAKHVKQFTDVLADEVQSLFEAGEADTWVSVRNLLASKTDVAESEFSNAHVDFKVPRSEIDKRLGYLKENARSVVERKARESAATGRVLMRMKDRFAKVFNHDENSKSGAWTSEQNIEEIERNALSASLKILEIMAAIRLDQTTDQIEHALFSSLMDGNGAVPASGATPDLLTSNAWEEVSPNATLLTPVECRSLWMQFKADIKYIINQATSAQGTLRQAKRAIKIVVGVAVVVGAAVVATVGAPTAMGIAARPEVAAVMKEVGPGLAAVMKDIGPEVLATLKDIGPEVAGAVRSLGPQIVTAVIAMMTNGFARPHQQ
ncbi:hypothetical protein POTOM_043404 [Populus tomentosa]|uniref:GB1/RHD3-type G domain-containing protein n=1 Tax=Populus tomentosa TaxID=118781 RepID=A0A8X7YLP0_POPTO|nr:hypothetical protein POTOM_043404 [Populus tomentosa]